MLIIGHRGAKGEAPENTVQSIQRALDDGADMVEFDLRTTRDDVVVLSHGPFLIKTHGIWRSVARNDFTTLRRLTEAKGAPLATFDEILDVVPDHRQLCIEFKRMSAVEPALKLLDKKYPSKKVQSEIFIESFYIHNLRRIRELWPHARLGFLFYRSWQLLKRRHRELNFYALMPFAKWPIRHDAKRARRLGLKLYVYGVHGTKILRKSQRAKVDGIITNFPEKMISLLRRYRS